MENHGREDRLENDLFFACSVIELVARSTRNRRGEVVARLGEKEVTRLIELADVLHCEPLEATASDLIERCGLTCGDFDNVASCRYSVPTHLDIAKVYKRLIAAVAAAQNIAPLDALTQVYASWISDKIDDYNSSMYYESPQYLYASYVEGRALAD